MPSKSIIADLVQELNQDDNIFPEVPEFESILDKLAGQIYVIDPANLRYVYMNKMAIEKLGWHGVDYTTRTPADDDEYFDEAQFRNLTDPLLRKEVTEIDFTRSLHGVARAEISIRLVPDKLGHDKFLVVVRPPNMIREQRSLISSVTELSPIATAVIHGKSGQVLYTNQKFRHKFQIPYTDNDGPNIAEIFTELTQTELAEILSEITYSDAGSITFEIQKPGVGSFEVSASRAELERGRQDLAFIVHDISERVERETQRHQFLATISHELKTPLASIIGTLSTMLYGGVTDGDVIAKLAGLAKTNADRLASLVEQILAKETAEMNVHRTIETDWFDFISESVRLNHYFAESAGVELTFSPKGTSAQVALDHGNFGRVLDNLISNAVRHGGSPGQIVVEADVKRGRAMLKVKDKGRGIPPEHLTEIFDWHFVGDASDSRRVGGTGLGLAICSKIVGDHNGEIIARNQKGGGACFEVSLPSLD